MATVTDRFLPNYALLMLWASLANAIPVRDYSAVLTHTHVFQ